MEGNNLLQKEECYELLFRRNPQPMYIYDTETLRFLDVNEVMITRYGYSLEDFVSMTIKDIRPVEDVDRLLDNLSKKQGRLSYEGIWRHLFKSGEMVYVEITSQPITFQGRPAELILAHDITQRIRIEDDLLQAKLKAEESDRLKSAFLANMSHEIRTPMNAILGFSQLLTEEEVTPENKEQFVRVIYTNANQLLHIIEDIIDISKIEVNQLKVDTRQTVKLNTLLFDLFLMFKSNANASGINLYISHGLSDSRATIFTDGVRLRQILSNLISNAMKFTSQGHVKAGYRLREETIEFFVEDTGIGIPEEEQSMIFEPFRQGLDEFSRKKFGGTGLGLSISKALVELLGGTIWLTSKVGKGTQFHFTVPYMIAENESIAEGTHENGSASSKVVLVAEDEVANYLYLEMLLMKDGFKTLHAPNGQEAIDLVTRHPEIALVLMDIRMPIMDGYEATRRIKDLKPMLPVIAQTAFAFADVRDKIFACGCDEILTKPILKNQVLDVLNRYLR